MFCFLSKNVSPSIYLIFEVSGKVDTAALLPTFPQPLRRRLTWRTLHFKGQVLLSCLPLLVDFHQQRTHQS
jgi:hypothetical protein